MAPTNSLKAISAAVESERRGGGDPRVYLPMGVGLGEKLVQRQGLPNGKRCQISPRLTIFPIFQWPHDQGTTASTTMVNNALLIISAIRQADDASITICACVCRGAYFSRRHRCHGSRARNTMLAILSAGSPREKNRYDNMI